MEEKINKEQIWQICQNTMPVKQSYDTKLNYKWLIFVSRIHLVAP